MKEVDTSNEFGVSVIGDDVFIMRPPLGRLSKERALVLAAWLAVLAADDPEHWEEVLLAVQCS